jgi:hypothetical protein
MSPCAASSCSKQARKHFRQFQASRQALGQYHADQWASTAAYLLQGCDIAGASSCCSCLALLGSCKLLHQLVRLGLALQQLLLHLGQQALLVLRSRCCRRDCSGRRRLLLLQLIQMLPQGGSFRLRVTPLLLLLLGSRRRGQHPLLRLCSRRLVLLQRLLGLLQLLSEHCNVS